MKNPRTVIRALLPIAMIAGVTTVGIGALYELRSGGVSHLSLSVANHPAEGTAMDEPAPSFNVPSLLDDSTIAFAPGPDGVTVINFFASWCEPCRIEAPGLEHVWSDYRKRGVSFIGVNERDDPAAGRAFVREFKLTYPIGQDPSGRLADDFALFGMPTTFVIDGEGVLRFRFVGYVNADDLRRVLDEQLGSSS